MAALVEEDWSEVDDFLYCARRLLRYSSRPGMRTCGEPLRFPRTGLVVQASYFLKDATTSGLFQAYSVAKN